MTARADPPEAVAFLILAHRAPAQLGRLVRRLLSERTSVHVHIDRRTSPQVHGAMVDALPMDRRVVRLERIRTPWSTWGPVEATLRGLRSILDAPSPPGHIALLSGQDYPLRPASAIVDFLAAHEGASFIPTWPMPSRLYDRDGGMYRVRHWHTAIGRRRVMMPVPRRYPAGLRPFGGSAFVVLDRETARAALAFTDAHPDVARFHRHVWAADEHYLPTILENAPEHGTLLNEHLWHIEWPPPPAKHPKVYRVHDFPRLAAAASRSSHAGGASRAKLFARKFDQEIDADVLDRIDAELLGPATRDPGG